MATNCPPPCTGSAGPFTVDGNSPSAFTPPYQNPNVPSIPADVIDLKAWQLSTANDTATINQYLAESLIIGGAPFNVYKLLGIYQQGQLTDVTGNGKAISNGDLSGFPASNAFDIYNTEWRSIQHGSSQIMTSAWIGYDFGLIMLPNGSRPMYSDSVTGAQIRRHVTSFAIKQSSNANNRCTTVRLERSDDGINWYGVCVVQLPDDDCLNTIYCRDSVSQRFWRLRPLSFNGALNDYWGVQALEMFEAQAPNIDEIQDKILMENRDRQYSTTPTLLKGKYELIDIASELGQLGIELPSQILTAEFNFLTVVSILGRPLVVGDIIELPFEIQYSANLRPIQKFLEVQDVRWSATSYAPSWRPLNIAVKLVPAYAQQENQSLFGDLADSTDSTGLKTRDSGVVNTGTTENYAGGNDKVFQDYFDVAQDIHAEAKNEVPEAGAEGSAVIRQWTSTEIANAASYGITNLQATGLNPCAYQVEDALPPNGLPYTEGNTFPTNVTDGQYFRMNYTGLSQNIPARLYRYSQAKGQWIFLEEDKRAFFNQNKPILQEYLTSVTRVPLNEITKTNPNETE